MHGHIAPTDPRPAHLSIWIPFCAFAAIAVFFLWEEHGAHVLGFIPYLFLLICPVIHLFMHRGHREHGRGR